MTAVVPGRLVVLDEPTNDVDPVRRRLLWDEIRSLADAGAGTLLVTHNVREAERVVDRLVVLDRGRVVAAGTPASLSANAHGHLTVECYSLTAASLEDVYVRLVGPGSTGSTDTELEVVA